MDSAKEIARDMLEAIQVDSSGFMGAIVKGIILFPVNLGYLGYDFIDTEHRSENLDDKFRFAALIKRVTLHKETIEMVIKPFIDNFISHVDIDKVTSFSKNVVGGTVGKVIFSQVTGVNLGRAIAAQGVASYVSGMIAGGVLAIGAEVSRAIYTSRYLRERNPVMYARLYRMGDLDLLYYLVEDIVRPYERACEEAERNAEKFNKICQYFFEGL
ncbi:hypothetical protein ACQKDS_20060 [Serratia sp. NPDC078593]|uniref:hypothetical protein n=1 Tax=unclassified Serratia (in: enterobacteria) TaxID=2647522 RepID=UPI0037D342F2